MKMIDFVYVDRYEDFDRKEELIELLVKNESSFNPPLSVWRTGNTVREKMEKYILPNDALALVLVFGEIVGVSHIKKDVVIDDFEFANNNLKIETTVINKDCRGKGLSTYLYRFIEEVNVSTLRRPFIFRSTWHGNQIQLHLYKKMGYDLLKESTYPTNPKLKRYLHGKTINILRLNSKA